MARHGRARVFVLAALLAPSPLHAQDSRTAVIEQMRAAKAANLHPYEPGKLEKFLLYVEREDPMRKIAPRNGFFVEYGYTGKPIGSGIGFGAGYRHDLFDRRARIVFEAGATKRRYHSEHVDFSFPELADGHLELGVELSNRHDPQEDFFGLGPASLEASRVSFRFDRREVQARAVANIVDGLRVGVRGARMEADVGRGTDRRFASIEERFTDVDAPGLAEQPGFSYGDLFAVFDRRDQPGNARAGSYYAVMLRHYTDLDFDRYNFRAFQADLQHFFPIFDKKRVFAVRGQVFSTSADRRHTVPFYFQPTVGGSTTLRSARDFRFRDLNALAVNVEYRWEAFSGLDMALFTDMGKVTPRGRELDFSRLEHAYGIGLRFNTYKAVVLRLDLSLAGGESPRYFIKFNQAF